MVAAEIEETPPPRCRFARLAEWRFRAEGIPAAPVTIARLCRRSGREKRRASPDFTTADADRQPSRIFQPPPTRTLQITPRLPFLYADADVLAVPLPSTGTPPVEL